MYEENFQSGQQNTEKKYKSYMRICVIVTVSVCFALTAGFVIAFFLITSSITGNPSRNIYNIVYNGDYSERAEYVTDMMGANVIEIYSTGTSSSEAGSLGTGFVITMNGSNPIAITNYHVVEGYNTFYARTIYEDEGYVKTAKLLGYDKYNDIAIMEMDSVYKAGSFLNLLDEKELDNFDRGSFFAPASTAEYLIAIGNALGEGISVVDGICSNSSTVITYEISKSRNEYKCISVLQTTAAINKGMSGCPIMNKYGQIVGVGTYTTDADDISYGVPIEVALEVYKDVINKNFDESSKQAKLLKHTTTSGSNKTTYDLNITLGKGASYYTVNALGAATKDSSSVTLYDGIGFSGYILSGRGNGSGGLIDSGSAAAGLKVTKSNLKDLNVDDIIVKIGDVDLTGQYGNLLSAFYKYKAINTTNDDPITLTLSDNTTVEWKGNGIRVVAK